MVGYNFTNIVSNNTNTVFDVVAGVNSELMLGWLFTAFLIGLTVVIYSSFMWSTDDVNRSIAGTAWITMILAIIFNALNLVPNLVLYIYLVGCALAMAFTWRKG